MMIILIIMEFYSKTLPHTKPHTAPQRLHSCDDVKSCAFPKESYKTQEEWRECQLKKWNRWLSQLKASWVLEDCSHLEYPPKTFLFCWFQFSFFFFFATIMLLHFQPLDRKNKENNNLFYKKIRYFFFSQSSGNCFKPSLYSFSKIITYLVQIRIFSRL
jgi:hypothetical protein